jgi:nicotinate phosphoribosyltransferase
MRWEANQPEFIINSLLDTDFYKFTMGQLIFRRYREVEVTFSLINRAKIPFAKFFSEADLRRELDHARKVRMTNSNLHYLRGTNEYSDRMFQEDYLQFLRDMELPNYSLEQVGDDFKLEFTGLWPKVTYWETLAMSIICELYSRAQMLSLSRFERDAVYAQGVKNLLEKIRLYKKYPKLTLSDFGTRRRFSGAWQRYVDSVLAEELKGQFRGTSNTLCADEFDLTPMGTKAHELDMVIAALAFMNPDNGLSDEEILTEAVKESNTAWWQLYGHGLSIALPDTFTTDFFLRVAPEMVANDWKGSRQDSGDPFKYGEKMINWYLRHGADPEDKLTVFSDKLNPARAVKIHEHFYGTLGNTFGIGTDMTNDLGLSSAEIVVKASRVNGVSTVKLSDDPGKAMGHPDVVRRYQNAISAKQLS